MKRKKTRYPGVVEYRTQSGDIIYYIIYRRPGGRQIEEKAGHRLAGMSPARAALLRAERISGRQSNAECREAAARRAQERRWTVGRLFEAYQRTLPPGRARTTDRTSFRRFSELHERTFADITTPDMEALQRRLAERLAPISVKTTITLLDRIKNYGVKSGLIEEPDKRRLYIRKPRADCRRTEVLTDGEQARLVALLEAEKRTQPGAVYMYLILLTGIRRTAAVNLRWDDLDEERGRIRLRGETAKNGRTDFVPVAREVLELTRLLPRRGPYLFPSPGDPTRPRSNFNRYVAGVKARAGLPEGFRPLHGLRHNFASRMASSGLVDIYTLQKLLTHQSPLMTQRYAHLVDAAMRRAGEAAAGIVLGRAKRGKGEP